ncbi:MAG: hypothetical protein Q7S80_01630 [bacterium]|nr:hypothetical protein [bacterium]
MILLYTLRTHCLLPMKKRRLVKKIARQLRALNQNERTGLRRDLEAESDRLQSEQDNQEPRQRRRTSQELMGIYAAMAYLHETVELPNGTISRLTGGEPSETAARGLSEVRVRDGG